MMDKGRVGENRLSILVMRPFVRHPIVIQKLPNPATFCKEDKRLLWYLVITLIIDYANATEN